MAAEEQGGKAAASAADFEPAAQKGAAARKTMRSGAVYGLDARERRRKELERAERLKKEIGEGPVTGIEDRLAYRFVKRAFDIVFSVAVLVAFCWLFAIIAVLIKIDDPKGPVFFKQERVGKNGKTFYMYKFRSMCVDAEERLAELRELNEKTGPVFKMAEDPRITRVGKWLRKLSLDELPQFINVLRSDIPLRILKTRPEFSEESMGAFALPAKSSTNKGKAFSQVASCLASGLRMRRISGFNCNCIGGMETQFLAKPVFGVSPVHSGALLQKSNNGLAKAAW
ncbi:sugar transferase [uncultured Senegalimassilia sp.]|uniref:sugar transferase n=1 Tax=uncultured Senegalimassilia sp. TaxID=1714350 RepID=UPI0026739D3F|nr:sugar transferase [uncultured Senegalimassilia sp.]